MIERILSILIPIVILYFGIKFVERVRFLRIHIFDEMMNDDGTFDDWDDRMMAHALALQLFLFTMIAGYGLSEFLSWIFIGHGF